MIVILIWSLNLIFNKMAFLVLLCVYIGSFLIRGFFSSLTPTSAYTWALNSHRSYLPGLSESRDPIFLVRGKKSWEALGSCFVLLPERGGWRIKQWTHFLISLCLKEGVLTPSVGKARYSNHGTSQGVKTAAMMVPWFWCLGIWTRAGKWTPGC